MRGATVVVVLGLSLFVRSSVSREQDVPSDAVLEAVRLLQDVKETLRVPISGMIDDAHEISQKVKEMVLKSDEVVIEKEKEMGHKKNVKENDEKKPQKEKVDQPSTPGSKLRIVGVRVDASSNSIPMERLVGADTSRQTGKESIPNESQEVVNIATLPNSEKISESIVKGRNGRARVVKMRRPISAPDAQESGSEAIDWAAFDPENVHDFEGFGRRIQPKNNKKDSSEHKNSHDSSILGVNDPSNTHNLSGTSKVNEIKQIAHIPEPSKISASTRELIDGKSQSYKPRVVTQSPTRSPTTASSTPIRKRVRIPSVSRLRTSSQVQSTSQATSKPTTEHLRITTPISQALSNENELDFRRILSKSQNSSPEEAPSFQFEPPPVSQPPVSTSSRLLRPASTKGNHITTLQPRPISTTSKFLRPIPTTSSRNPSKSVRPVTIRRPASPSTTKTSAPQVSSTHQPLALSSLVPGAPFRAPITPLLPVSSLRATDQTQKPLSTLTTIHPTRKSTISRVPQIFSTASFDFSRIPHTNHSPTTPRASVSPFSTSQRPFFNSGPTEDFIQSLFTSRPTASLTNSAKPFTHPSFTTSLHSPSTSLRPIIATTQRPLSSPSPFVTTIVPTITTSRHPFATSSNPRNNIRPTVTTNAPSLTSRRPKIATSHLDISSQRPRVTTNSPLLNSNFPDIFKSNPSRLFTSPSSTTLQDDGRVTTSTDPVTVIKSPEPPFTGFSFQSFRPGSTSSSSFNIGAPAVATHNEQFTNQIPNNRSPKGSNGNPTSQDPQKQPQRKLGFSPSPLSTTFSDNFTPSSLATIGRFTSSTPGFGVRRRPTSFPRVSTAGFTTLQSPAGNSGPRITTFRPTFISPTTPRPQPSPSLLPIDKLAPVTPQTSFVTRFSRPQTIASEITKHKPPLTSDINNFPKLPISNPNIFQILQQQSLHKFEPQHLTTSNPREVTTSNPKQTLISSRPRDQITTFRPKQLSTTSRPSTQFTTSIPRQSLSTSTRPLTNKAPFFQFFSLGGKKLVTSSSSNNPPSTPITTGKTSQPHITTPRISVTTPFPFLTTSRPVLTSPLPIVTAHRSNAFNSHPPFNRISSPRPTTANIFEEVPSSITPLDVNNRINNFHVFSLNEDRPSLALFPQNAFVNSQNNVLSPIPVTQPSLTTPLSPFLAAFSQPGSNRVHESQHRNKEKNIHLFRPHIQNNGVLPRPSPFSPTLPPIKDKFPSRPLNSFTGQSTLSTAAPIITTARGPFTFDPSRFRLTTTQEPFVFRHTTTRRSITAANSFSNGGQATSLRPILREPSTIPPLISSTTPNTPMASTSPKASWKQNTRQPHTKPNREDYKPHSIVQPINEVSPVTFTSPRPKVQTNIPSFGSFGAVTSFESVRRSTTAKPITESALTGVPTEASHQVILHQLTTKLPLQETSASTTQPVFGKRPITVLPATAMTESNRLVPTLKSFPWSSNKASHSTRKPMLSPLTSPNVIFQPSARSGSQLQSEFKGQAKNHIPSPSPAKSSTYSLKDSPVPKELVSSTQKPRTTAKVPSNVFRPNEPITGKSFIFVRSGGHEYRVVWL